MVSVINSKTTNLYNLFSNFKYLIIILYKIMFEITYVCRVSVVYSYFGEICEINIIKAIFSWLIFMVYIMFFSLLKDNKLKSFLCLMIYLTIVPSVSLFWLKNESIIVYILINIYWFIWLFMIYIINKSGKGDNVTGSGGYAPDFSNNIMRFLTCWLILSTLFFSYKYGNMRLFISFSDVYTYRNVDEKMPSIFMYLFNWNLNVLLPFWFAVSIKQKKYIKIIIGIVLFLLSYSIYGNKSMFMTMLLGLGIGLLNAFNLSAIVDVMIGFALIVYQVIMMFLPIRLMIGLFQRLTAIPAEAHYYYYDFFNQPGHDFLYLRESILRSFFKSPYNNTVSLLIGSTNKYFPVFTEGDYSNMNNGLFSDAYQNFGVVGVVIYPIVIVLTLYIIFKTLHIFDDCIQYIIMVVMAVYLISGYYFSWLLTGGVIVLIIMCKFLNKYVDMEKIDNKQNDIMEETIK